MLCQLENQQTFCVAFPKHNMPPVLQDIEERLMVIKDVVLMPQCQLYYDFAGPHNNNLYGKPCGTCTRRAASQHYQQQLPDSPACAGLVWSHQLYAALFNNLHADRCFCVARQVTSTP